MIIPKQGDHKVNAVLDPMASKLLVKMMAMFPRYPRLLPLYIILTIIFVDSKSKRSLVYGWQQRRYKKYHAAFTTTNNSLKNINNDHALVRYKKEDQHCNPFHYQSIILKKSSDDYNDEETIDTLSPNNNNEDPDGVPLFDTNDRTTTLFGLEPNSDVDPLDNGLQFTGPLIMFASIYVCLSLVFGDGMPL